MAERKITLKAQADVVSKYCDRIGHEWFMFTFSGIVQQYKTLPLDSCPLWPTMPEVFLVKGGQ